MHYLSLVIPYYALVGLNFIWRCRNESAQDPDDSDEAGCYYRVSNEESAVHELRVNSSLMAENTSYFITVQVTKDVRQAEYTPEVFIVPGDPPKMQIRFVAHQIMLVLELYLWIPCS